MIAGIIISGIPLDTPENRKRARKAGVNPDKIPWPEPYKDSTESQCEDCQTPIWIGPETFHKMTEIMPIEATGTMHIRLVDYRRQVTSTHGNL